ncbi:hypothetical protein ACWD3I_47110 [Streptomyces sp. NPDC002817]|uniref:hypothetical protein n=1 Tax=Streptomyces sp. NPDC088357 TaxID=3154655 RepID=UPI0034494E03
MRKILATAATLGLAGLGVIVPANGAQAASAHCDELYNLFPYQYFYAFADTDCYDSLGSAEGDDSNWGNAFGPFKWGDTNEAESIIHKGTSGRAVKVFNGAGTDWGGGYNCIKMTEYYVSDLRRNDFTSGYAVEDAISSHKWVWEAECNGNFMQ